MSVLLDHPIQALSEYVGHASVSADSAFDDGVNGARGFAQARLEELGFSVDLIETPINPVLSSLDGRTSGIRGSDVYLCISMVCFSSNEARTYVRRES